MLALDAETLQARMDAPCTPDLGARHVLELHADVEPLLGEVVDVVPSPSGTVVDYAVKELPLQAVRELLTLIDRLTARGLAVQNDVALPREQETITDPRRIREVLRALMANRAGARAVSEQGRPLTRLVPADITPELALPLEWHTDDVFPNPPFSIEMVSHFSVYRFTVTRIEARGERLATAVPTRIERSRHRAWIRARPRENDMFISFTHPRWPELRIRRPLIDLSLDGAAFDTQRLSDMLYPGLAIQDLSIQSDDRERFDFRGIIRHVGHPGDWSGEDVAGILLLPRSEDDGRRWRDQVLRLLCPNTRADGTFAAQVWELLDRAGYFSLSGKSHNDFLPQREGFGEFCHRISNAPHLGCQVVRPSGRGVEGSVAAIRPYERSTFFYQTARHPNHVTARGQVLRDIHLDIMTRTYRDSPNTDWLMAMVQETARFPRLAYYDIPRRYVDSGRSYILPFRALQTRTFDRMSPWPDATETTFAVANDEERALVCEVLGRTKNPIYLDALDLVPERFDLSSICDVWGKAGILRKREVLVARTQAGPMVAAIVELVGEGVHLFGLLDSVRIVPLRDEVLPNEMLVQLLDHVREFYKSHHKAMFTYHFEGGDNKNDMGHALDAGFQDMGGAFLILLRWELVPEMLEQIYQVAAPRDLPPLPHTTP
ncbi:hypothetical protein [Pendulispora albinea]|uniref:PilZ domain-containing protein n=1 Tax=Pendulispora albinea TaxID=2741071 RepID=A0ABZ2MBN8_9BACT